MKVLIVDDTRINLKLLRAILEADGHEVFEARDGEEALAVLESLDFDAIVSDILMPKMDGYRLCHEVRSSERLKTVPFIFYTAAYTSPADEKLCTDLGADAYVRKPATSNDLLSALNKAVSGPRHQPTIEMSSTDVLKEYSERLVDKLEEKNVELNQKADELSEAHLQLRTLLAHSPAVIYALELDGEKPVPTLVSDNMERLLGIAGEDTDYDWWVSSLHPDDRDRVIAAKRIDGELHGVTEEYRIRHTDGSYRWIQDDSRVVRDDDGVATKLVGVWTDISKRKEVELALIKSEEQLREMLENVEMIAVIIDLNGTVIFCNEYLLTLTGWSRDEVIGQSWFPRFNSKPEEEAQATFDQIEAGLIPTHHDSLLATKSGEIREIHWNYTVLKNATGVVVGNAGIGEDVTERKLAAQALRQALDETERKVEERTAMLALKNEELLLAKEAADKANRSKSEFLSRMSHELRTPMNSILGFGQLLEFSDLDEGQRDCADHILRAGRHLLKLINEVLEIARIEAGSIAVSLEPVDLGEVIEECLSLMRPAAEERQITIGSSLMGPAIVNADRQRISQVLLNLISNAIKYNVQGGSVRVRVVNGPDGTAVVEVADTGIGIAESMLHRLYMPFDRLTAAGTNVEGTGLGLTLSKSLVEAMGGELSVESMPGVGSIFRVQLCWAESNSMVVLPAPHAIFDATVWAGLKGRILVIEDNLMNTQLLSRMFTECPQVELINTMQGRLGLQLAVDNPPDVILLDLHLPDMSGKDVLAALREDPNLCQVPVIILTADAFSDQSKQLLEAGAFRYLTKPFVLSELIDAVASALAKRGN